MRISLGLRPAIRDASGRPGRAVARPRVVLARLDASAWARFFSSQEEAMARFLDCANLPLGPDGEIRPTLRLVVHRPADFRPPSREAWRRIGGGRRDGDGKEMPWTG